VPKTIKLGNSALRFTFFSVVRLSELSLKQAGQKMIVW